MLNRELQSYGSCEHCIEDVIALTDYLRKTDPQIDDELIKGFKQVCYFASFNGSVKLLNKKKEFELCTKWTSVRKQVKLALYVKRQLKPRPSDADFEEKMAAFFASIPTQKATSSYRVSGSGSQAGKKVAAKKAAADAAAKRNRTDEKAAAHAEA